LDWMSENTGVHGGVASMLKILSYQVRNSVDDFP